ncbi:hypothetical protein ACRRTK_008600 [Alexandromys fortis]
MDAGTNQCNRIDFSQVFKCLSSHLSFVLSPACSSSQDRTAAGTVTAKALAENPKVSTGAALVRGSAIVQLLPAWEQATSNSDSFADLAFLHSEVKEEHVLEIRLSQWLPFVPVLSSWCPSLASLQIKGLDRPQEHNSSSRKCRIIGF